LDIEAEIEKRLARKREQERSRATSSDGVYCSQIMSYKKSLSQQFKGGATFETTNKKLDLPDRSPPREERRRSRPVRRERSRSPSPVRTQRLTKEQMEQRKSLLARYGDASRQK